VRIIAGHYRGTRLHTPSGVAIRPTSDRLRESIFNIIGPRIRGKRILDLFAGTGAMGIEALSRGATHAIFIDNNAQSLDLIHRNIEKVSAHDRTTVIAWDAAYELACLQDHAASDIIFMDPPYNQGLIHKALQNLVALPSCNSMIVVEHAAKDALNDLPTGLLLRDQRRYGKTLVSFLSGML
jgi:16S rRNA (guanine966-N2)-methyltransferase